MNAMLGCLKHLIVLLSQTFVIQPQCCRTALDWISNMDNIWNIQMWVFKFQPGSVDVDAKIQQIILIKTC